MNPRYSMMACLAFSALVGNQSFPVPALGQSGETAGMITEIKMGRGRVEVRPVGSQEWQRAGPLLALRAGDQVRATEDAWAVIVLTVPRGSIRVEAAGSPFVIPPPRPEESKVEKARALLESSLDFLGAAAKQAPLTTRGPRPPVILSPRNGPVLQDSLTFEWLPAPFSRYTLRIAGPQGIVLEKKGLTGGMFNYPPDAVQLAPGIRYTFQILSGNDPPQEAWFEVAGPTRTEAIRQDIKELEQALGPTASPTTLATLRAGLLARSGLFHDARLTVIAALSKDPEEPTLHLLLGYLYAKAGLSEQAAEAFNEARALMSGRGRR